MEHEGADAMNVPTMKLLVATVLVLGAASLMLLLDHCPPEADEAGLPTVMVARQLTTHPLYDLLAEPLVLRMCGETEAQIVPVWS